MLILGDSDGDNRVTLSDFTVLWRTFGACAGAGVQCPTPTTTLTAASVRDFALFAGSYGQTGAAGPSASLSVEREPLAVTLAGSPALDRLHVGQVFGLQVKLGDGDEPVYGADVRLRFDPRMVQVVAIEPASALPVRLFAGYDNLLGVEQQAPRPTVPRGRARQGRLRCAARPPGRCPRSLRPSAWPLPATRAPARWPSSAALRRWPGKAPALVSVADELPARLVLPLLLRSSSAQAGTTKLRRIDDSTGAL